MAAGCNPHLRRKMHMSDSIYSAAVGFAKTPTLSLHAGAVALLCIHFKAANGSMGNVSSVKRLLDRDST